MNAEPTIAGGAAPTTPTPTPPSSGSIWSQLAAVNRLFD